jgi:uncharacterized protein involved in cysteine biosynthesis
MRDIGGGFFLLRFWSGASFAASGIGFTFRHKKLLLWSIVPMLVQAVIFVALLVSGIMLSGDLVDKVRPDAGHWYSFVGGPLFFVSILVVILLSAVGSLFLGGVVCDPFYDTLSETTESILVGRDVSTPFIPALIAKGILRELLALPWRLFLYLLVAVPLWLFSLTGVGSVVAVPLSLMWTWMFVALAGCSRGMARHAVGGRARIAGVFKVPFVSLGFGAVGWLMSYVPLTYPFLVVGGTRLYLALAAHDRIPSTLTADDKRALTA